MTPIPPQFTNQNDDGDDVMVNREDFSGQKTMGNSTTMPSIKQFYNLPISRKIGLIPWFSFGALIIILGAGSLILRQSLKSQLLQQAESQLAVTNIQYNIKIDQMGFGFRGQSDNSAIVEASDNFTNYGRYKSQNPQYKSHYLPQI